MLLLLALQSLKLAANSIKNIKDFSSFTETSIAVAVVDVVVVLTQMNVLNFDKNRKALQKHSQEKLERRTLLVSELA